MQHRAQLLVVHRGRSGHVVVRGRDQRKDGNSVIRLAHIQSKPVGGYGRVQHTLASSDLGTVLVVAKHRSNARPRRCIRHNGRL